MKLKTLNDIEFSSHIEEDIKAEAIKWVKSWIEDRASEPKPNGWDRGWWAGEIEAFSDFFNITEEDLK